MCLHCFENRWLLRNHFGFAILNCIGIFFCKKGTEISFKEPTLINPAQTCGIFPFFVFSCPSTFCRIKMIFLFGFDFAQNRIDKTTVSGWFSESLSLKRNCEYSCLLENGLLYVSISSGHNKTSYGCYFNSTIGGSFFNCPFLTDLLNYASLFRQWKLFT